MNSTKFNTYTALLFTMVSINWSCTQKADEKKLPEFDKNGKRIVYSEDVYINMWIKNRNLKVTVIDTFCISQTSKAIKDIKNGKLVYCGIHQISFPKMAGMLRKYGIQTKEHVPRCLRIGGFEPFCYKEIMDKEIAKRYGSNFIDSIFRAAQKEYIVAHPNVAYFEDGVDLREKYIPKK